MKLAVNPNRMQLLRLRKRLAIARRGHKLLKDKQEQLMQNFIRLIGELKGKRAKLEEMFIDNLRGFLTASAKLSTSELESFFYFPAMKLDLLIKETRILSLRVPSFELIMEGDPYPYSFYTLPPTCDRNLQALRDLLPDLAELASLEKRLKLLADEIDRTRRRVNALEYILIPNIEETIRYIRLKLDEQERSNITRLMRVKKIVKRKREI